MVGWDSGAPARSSGKPRVTMSEATFLTLIGAEVAEALAFVLFAISILRGRSGSVARAAGSEVPRAQRGRVDIASGAGVLLLVVGGLGLALGLRGAGLPLLTIW